MTPQRPSALPKISTINIFINVPFYAASVNAAPEPIIPTQIPQPKFEIPHKRPAAKIAYDFFFASWKLLTYSLGET